MRAIFLLLTIIFFILSIFFTRSTDSRLCGQEVAIAIDNSGDYEEIRYCGDIQFNEDETDVRSISPRGYIRYVKNGSVMEIESDKNGELSYRARGVQVKTPTSQEDRNTVKEAISDIIGFGYKARERLERIYRTAERPGLLGAVGDLKADHVRVLYLEYLFSMDSLTDEEMAGVVGNISSLSSGIERLNFLERLTVHHLSVPVIADASLQVIQQLGSAEKYRIIMHFISQRIIPSHGLNGFLGIIDQLGYAEKKSVIQAIIGDSTLASHNFKKLASVIDTFGSDIDKAGMIKNMIMELCRTEDEWLIILDMISRLSRQNDRVELLTSIAFIKPAGEKLKSELLRVAKTINSDSELDKVLRIIQE